MALKLLVTGGLIVAGLALHFTGRHYLLKRLPSATALVPAVQLTTAANYSRLLNLTKDSLALLPIGNVTIHTATTSQGVAVLIPQSHRYPGSAPEDVVNNTAEIAQNQIYQIIPELINRYNINFIMAEGDSYCEVSSEKIDGLAEKITSRERFSLAFQELKESLLQKGYAPALIEKFSKDAEAVLRKNDRAIILAGAPYKLKAEGSSFTLFGSENPATVEEGKVLVRDYIYLEDRLNQLQGPMAAFLPPGSAVQIPQSFDIQSLLSLLKPLTPENALRRALQSLLVVVNSKGDEKTSQDITSIERDLTRLIESDSVEGGQTPAPSREDNPYMTISDRKALEAKLSETEGKITKTVIEKRNQEAADNFAQALTERGEKTGILQYGAGHEEGLVKELQARGLSVVVITPQAVN